MSSVGAVGGVKAKALSVAYSCCTGWGLNVKLPESPEQGDLVVEGMVVSVGTPNGKCNPAVVLDIDRIIGRDLNVTMAEMYKLTEMVGKGRPAPHRTPSSRLRARSDDYIATSMRLTPFGRAMNPSPEDIRTYAPTVKRETDCAARKYANLLSLMKMEKQDLYQVGMCYLVIYLHRLRDLQNEKRNGANLTLFLQQEFKHWANVTAEYLKNVYFGSAGVSIRDVVGSPVPCADFHDAAVDAEASYTFDIEKPAGIDDEPDFRDAEEERRYERKAAIQNGRHRMAKRRAREAELADRLSMLSHDDLVERLSTVMHEERHDVEARELAEKMLVEHCKTCAPCQAAWDAHAEREREDRKLRRGKYAPRVQEYVPDVEVEVMPADEAAAL